MIKYDKDTLNNMSFPALAETTNALNDYNALSFALSAATERNQAGEPTYNFGGGYPNPEILRDIVGPAMLAIINRMHESGEEVESALQYAGASPFKGLRDTLAHSVTLEAEGLSIPPERIVVTHGLQEMIDLLGRTLLDPGDVVLVGTPTYPGALQAFSLQPGIEVWGVQSDSEGSIPDAIKDAVLVAKRRGRTIKLLYELNGGNPDTDQILTQSRGEDLLALSQEYNFALFQDDAYEGLVLDDTTPCRPLVGLSQYASFGRTFSKKMAPGLRVAWSVLPDNLMPAVLGFKGRSNLTTSPYLQRVVAHYIQSADFDENTRKINGIYRQSRDQMMAAIASQSAITPNPARIGMFVWAANNVGVNMSNAQEEITRDTGVLYVPGSDCVARIFIGDQSFLEKFKSYMRLNHTFAPSAEYIYAGLRALNNKLVEIASR